MIDLSATYAYVDEDGRPRTVTPRVRDRVRDGVRLVSVAGVAALLTDALEEVPEGHRAHVVWALGATRIVLSDKPRDTPSGGYNILSSRDGRVMVSNPSGTQIVDSRLLELGERLHDQLIGEN